MSVALVLRVPFFVMHVRSKGLLQWHVIVNLGLTQLHCSADGSVLLYPSCLWLLCVGYTRAWSLMFPHLFGISQVGLGRPRYLADTVL